jgi:hypothetical protein
MRGTLRTLEVIEEPGKGQLKEGETIRERTEAFLGKEAIADKEAQKLTPDSREETMALWYAGLEPDAANLRKVRAFFKSPEYLRIRTNVNAGLEKIAAQQKQHSYELQFNLAVRTDLIKNKLAQLFSASSDENEMMQKENAINDQLRMLASPYEFQQAKFYPSDNIGVNEGNIDLFTGYIAEKFDMESLEKITHGRVMRNPEAKRTQRELFKNVNKELYRKTQKIIVAEILPFIAEQLAKKTTSFAEVDKINNSLPGFVTFNEHDGPTMTEDIPGTGGKDAINRLASQRFHDIKKQQAEQQVKAEQEAENLAARQSAILKEVSEADNHIRTLIKVVYDAIDNHNKVAAQIDEFTNTEHSLNEERKRIFSDLQYPIKNLVKEGVESPDMSPARKEFMVQIMASARKKAGKMLTSKQTKMSIESDVGTIEKGYTRIEEIEKELALMDHEANAKLLETIKALRGIIARQIKELKEAIGKRRAIEPAGRMHISNVNFEPSGVQRVNFSKNGSVSTIGGVEEDLGQQLEWYESHSQ